MDQYSAVGIAEGWIDPPGDTPDEHENATIEAWQYLHDTGLAYRLQGWFGRTARNLLEKGIIIDRKEVQNEKH